MAKSKSIDRFYVIVVDQDKKEFSVEGPTFDDRRWHEARKAAAKEDRHIDVYAYQNEASFEGRLPDRETLIEEHKRSSHLRHLKYVPEGSILGKYMG